MFGVPLAVPVDLWQPVGLIRFGPSHTFFAVVPVPETAVDENGFLTANESYIWLAGQVFPVNPVASETKFPQQSARSQFRGGVLTADAPHVFTTAYSHTGRSDGEIKRQVAYVL